MRSQYRIVCRIDIPNEDLGRSSCRPCKQKYSCDWRVGGEGNLTDTSVHDNDEAVILISGGSGTYLLRRVNVLMLLFSTTIQPF
jgi:hypothetical protein